MFTDLLDHVCRVWRRTETLGTRSETVVTYAVPAGYEQLACAVTRRRSVLGDEGTGLKPVGQRTVYLGHDGLTWRDRDVVEVFSGPSLYDGAMRLEVVSIAVPRGHHVELVCEEFAGDLPTGA
jgi:hypothetical protein